MLANGGWDLIQRLTRILLTWTKWRAPTNASKWRMGFNSKFKGLKSYVVFNRLLFKCSKQALDSTCLHLHKQLGEDSRKVACTDNRHCSGAGALVAFPINFPCSHKSLLIASCNLMKSRKSANTSRVVKHYHCDTQCADTVAGKTFMRRSMPNEVQNVSLHTTSFQHV